MDWQALKAADAALGIADPAAAAEALNAQTVTAPCAINKRSARELLYQPGIMALWQRFAAQQVSNLATPTPQDQLVLLVQTFYLTLTTPDIDTIDLTSSERWADFLGKCQMLIAASAGMTIPLLTQDILDHWTALRTLTVPAWPLSISDQDIIAVRGDL